MKKRILSIALVAAMLAIAVTGGTLAYLKDTEGVKNVMTAGKVDIVQNEYMRDNSAYVDQHLIPAVYNDGVTDPVDLLYDGTYEAKDDTAVSIFDEAIDNEVDKFISVKNTGTEDAYVRTIMLVETTTYEDGTWTNDDLCFHINKGDNDNHYWMDDRITIDGKYYAVSVFTYGAPVAPDAETAPSLCQVYLAPDADNEWYEKIGTLDIFVFSQAVQSAGFTDNDEGATFALNAAFGEVTADNLNTWYAGRIEPTA